MFSSCLHDSLNWSDYVVVNSARFIYRVSHYSALTFASISVSVPANCTHSHYYWLTCDSCDENLIFRIKMQKIKRSFEAVREIMWLGFSVLGASYCVVDPAVGDLRSSSVSEDTVLHALHTRVFPQVPEGRLVLFHIYGWHTNNTDKWRNKWSKCGALIVSDQLDTLEHLQLSVIEKSDGSAPQCSIDSTSQRFHCVLEIKTAGCKL